MERDEDWLPLIDPINETFDKLPPGSISVVILADGSGEVPAAAHMMIPDNTPSETKEMVMMILSKMARELYVGSSLQLTDPLPPELLGDAE